MALMTIIVGVKVWIHRAMGRGSLKFLINHQTMVCMAIKSQLVCLVRVHPTIICSRLKLSIDGNGLLKPFLPIYIWLDMAA